ncbi:hypothetical protein ACP4OV_001777 [Aristida adscensionis]
MATTDQTLPSPVPVPPNPNPGAGATAPADPAPPPPPSAARKLPIKRRSPRPSSPSPSSSASPDSSSGPLPPSAAGAGSDAAQHPPFKFQRIWSESDELRFLQGLLGCGAQGLVFPRDLNVFYDRFSESMPQPYTRSQLSEKLRRLRNKFRGMSARVAKGLDPARLAPHDRDVLHLCSRLWDPANAATSPFAASPGASGNKRRRANPRAAAPLPAASGDSNSHDYNGISSSAAPGLFPDGHGDDVFFLEQEGGGHLGVYEGQALLPDSNLGAIAPEQPETAAAITNGNTGIGSDNKKTVVPCSNELRMANTVLDVFEECLREAKVNGIINAGTNADGSAEESELARRWRAQRINELDVLSRRLRLLVENAAAAAGH